MSNQSIIVSSNEESYITATILVPTPIKRSPMPKQRREPGPNVDLSKTSWIYEYLYRGNGVTSKGWKDASMQDSWKNILNPEEGFLVLLQILASLRCATSDFAWG